MRKQLTPGQQLELLLQDSSIPVDRYSVELKGNTVGNKIKDIYKETLITIEKNNRVCPKADRWHELYKMLPELEEGSLKREPALPLILAGWWYSSDKDKSDRLRQHILWAQNTGVLGDVYAFLDSLGENDWHHLDEV